MTSDAAKLSCVGRSLQIVAVTVKPSDRSGADEPAGGPTPWIVEVGPEGHASDDADLANALTLALDEVARGGGGNVQLWIQDVTDQADEAARSLGAVAYRDLWQVRCPLPAARSTIETRAFTPEDAAALVAVNNRAFAWHPEQSGMTAQSLALTMSEPWFNADGFRLYERDGELLGFCWTKVHADMDPVHGEIYVIAVDPAAHGQGLGIPMTLAGLDWISDQGIEQALLYVESDNDPANATYAKIGFTHHQTNRAYNLTVAAS